MIAQLKKAIISPLFCIIILFCIISRVYAPTLSITVTTDKQGYYPGDTVQIDGELTQNQVPVPDGLVGLEVRDPINNLIIMRTLSTGVPPPYVPYVVVYSVTPCDGAGNPLTSFQRGTLAYFKLYVKNWDVEPREALMTFNTYDNKNVPFGTASIKVTLNPQSAAYPIISIPIATDAALGTATVYANAYTDWPRLLGTPHCEEVSATFEITGGSFSTTQPTISAVNGTFNTAYVVSSSSTPGTNTMYVASNYEGENAFANITFKVYIQGDLDRDGDIDYRDLGKFRTYYVYGYNPDADFNRDGVIDFLDLFIFRKNYIKYV